MTPFGFESRWRDALLDAMIPSPGNGLPALADVDRGSFWRRFEQAAPWTLRAGFRTASLALGGLAPLLLGYRRSFARLDAAERDDVLRRAAGLPGGDASIVLLKLVACLAYFDDPRVQAIARAPERA